VEKQKKVEKQNQETESDWKEDNEEKWEEDEREDCDEEYDNEVPSDYREEKTLVGTHGRDSINHGAAGDRGVKGDCISLEKCGIEAMTLLISSTTMTIRLRLVMAVVIGHVETRTLAIARLLFLPDCKITTSRSGAGHSGGHTQQLFPDRPPGSGQSLPRF